MEATPSIVLARFKAMLDEVFSGAKVTRPGAGDTGKPTRMEPGGLVVMRDGDAGDPEVILSPLRYIYTHRIVLEIAPFQNDDAREALRVMLVPFAARIGRDPFLGGLADFIEVEAPNTDQVDTLGAPSLAWAEVGVLVTYTTSNPLG